jgi:hypothetical protein
MGGVKAWMLGGCKAGNLGSDEKVRDRFDCSIYLLSPQDIIFIENLGYI